MIEAVRPVSPAILPLQPLLPTGKTPSAPPSTLKESDRLQKVDPGQLKSDAQIKAYLAPAFDRLIQAGYGDAVAALRKARFRVTDGKFLKVEYYAATNFMNTISLAADHFLSLGPAGQAGVLLHESVHLRQGVAYRTASTISSGYGLSFKRNFAEIAAYKVQWEACPKLGLKESGPDSEIYWEARTALEEAGILPRK